MTAPLLARKTFTVSRQSEFASTAELAKATGHPVERWPLIIVKELIDNGLDAAEEAKVPPDIEVIVDKDGITVADRGPGIPAETVASIADYTVRSSSREAYVSPTRGAQGNALQTILAMGFALSQSRSETIIESRGVRHTIAVDFDPVRRVPRVERAQAPSTVKNGVRVRVAWPDSACSIFREARAGFLPLVDNFSWLNPHLWLELKLDGVRVFEAQSTDLAWHKLLPSQPTSSHWYNNERLSRLICATISDAEDRRLASPFVRDFIAEFAGLSGTAKRRDICEKIGAQRLTLAEFFAKGGEGVCDLLLAMQEATRPMKPDDLGFLGKEHLLRRMTEVGAPSGDLRLSAGGPGHRRRPAARGGSRLRLGAGGAGAPVRRRPQFFAGHRRQSLPHVRQPWLTRRSVGAPESKRFRAGRARSASFRSAPFFSRSRQGATFTAP